MTARRAALRPESQRLTPAEIAALWFRRGRDFAPHIHEEFPDFPKAGPDGLYLLAQVRAWFEVWHGLAAPDPSGLGAQSSEAMGIARYGKRPGEAPPGKNP